MKSLKYISYCILVVNIQTVSSQCLAPIQNSDSTLESYINNHFTVGKSEQYQLNPIFDSIVTYMYSKDNDLEVVVSKVRAEPDWDEYYSFNCPMLRIEDVFTFVKSFYKNLRDLKFTDNEKYFVQKERYPDGSSYDTEYFYKKGTGFINLKINGIGPSSDNIIIKRGKQNLILLKIEFRGT